MWFLVRSMVVLCDTWVSSVHITAYVASRVRGGITSLSRDVLSILLAFTFRYINCHTACAALRLPPACVYVALCPNVFYNVLAVARVMSRAAIN